MARTRAGPRQLKVVETQRTTADTLTIVFDNETEVPLRFVAGQHLTLLLGQGTIDGYDQALRRTYSICSDPGDQRRLAITVRRLSGGRASGWLNDRVVGDELQALGPSGRFGHAMASMAAERVVLVGGGVGITPLLPIARQLLAETTARVELLYGNQAPEKIIFLEELAALAAQQPERFSLLHLLSGADQSEAEPPHARRGRLAGKLLDELLPPDDEALYFLCAPRGLTEGISTHLRQGGVPAARVRVERFDVGRAAEAIGARGGAPHEVLLARQGRRLSVAPGQTVLAAAQAAGAQLPSSCAMGICGYCKQRVLSGEVLMDEPNCLSEEERASGLRLMCVGRPLSSLKIDA